MSPTDPVEAAARAKRAATMLREARALQRCFDKLAGPAAQDRAKAVELLSVDR